MAQTAICSNCQTANPEGAHFCMSCGAALAVSCPSCGTPAPAGARFCLSCGTAGPPGAAGTRGPGPPAPGAAPAPAPSTPGAPAASPHSEERRTVTVLFADISGYTSVA